MKTASRKLYELEVFGEGYYVLHLTHDHSDYQTEFWGIYRETDNSLLLEINAKVARDSDFIQTLIEVPDYPGHKRTYNQKQLIQAYLQGYKAGEDHTILVHQHDSDEEYEKYVMRNFEEH